MQPTQKMYSRLIFHNICDTRECKAFLTPSQIDHQGVYDGPTNSAAYRGYVGID